jgi:hypothetical protein
MEEGIEDGMEDGIEDGNPERETFSRKKGEKQAKKENPNPSSIFCVFLRLLAAKSHPHLPRPSADPAINCPPKLRPPKLLLPAPPCG